MNKDFHLFQKEFKKWQGRFGLTGYKVYFKYEELEASFADIQVSQSSRVVTVRLNSNLPDKDNPFKDVKADAKHEALHLLVSRLEENGRYRYCSDAEIYESTEELVVKLQNLIPDRELLSE